VGEAAGLLDDAVDGFGAAVGDAAGGEVGQDLGPPLPQCPAQAGDLGDRAGVQGVEQFLGQLAALSRGGRVVDAADLLIDLPDELDFTVGVTDWEVLLKALVLSVGEVLDAGEQGAADPVERVVLVASSSQPWLAGPGGGPRPRCCRRA